MPRVNVATLTIFWPDDKWDKLAEIEYLVGTLRGLADLLEEDNNLTQTLERSYFNPRGRQFARLHMQPKDL